MGLSQRSSLITALTCAAHYYRPSHVTRAMRSKTVTLESTRGWPLLSAHLLTVSKRYQQAVDIVGVGGVHAVDEGGAQGNGAGLQHSRVYVLAAEAVLVGGALLHQLPPHFFVFLLEKRLDLARFFHQLFFLDGEGGVASEDVLQLPLALQFVPVGAVDF